MLQNYFQRSDFKTKEYDQVEFLAGRVLQSAELNDMQAIMIDKISGIANALFKDGDVVSGAAVAVDISTGAASLAGGAIFLRGAVRGVAPATMTVNTTGTVAIGVYIQQTDVTENEDPTLRDPASLTRNYNQPGAGRLKLHVCWGHSGDGQTGDFYPVYSVQDGVVVPKEPPPSIDAVTQAIAAYDRDSSGSSYVVAGMLVTQMPDLVTGEQVYTVDAGRARVAGYGVTLNTARRLVYAATPNLRTITSEPHASTGTASQRVNFNNGPASAITSIQITSQKTVSVTHGAYTGVTDALPDPTVFAIVSVVQGGTTYAQGTDYRLTSGNVDWSPTGIEPSPGSTYSVTYQYINTVSPDSWDSTGFNVTGAVSGTQILVTYNQQLPRYDRLVIDAAGSLSWIQGVSAAINPLPPTVPSGQLELATIYQPWTIARTVNNDGVRMVPMSDIAAINGRLDMLTGLIAQATLQANVTLIDASQKKGLFVDPLLDDSMRDAGTAQTAAVFGGNLTLPVAITSVTRPPSDVTVRTSIAYALTPVIAQRLITGSVKVNPYMAFSPLPAGAALSPAVDQWTQVNTTWASPVTQRIINSYAWGGWGFTVNASNTATKVLSANTYQAEYLRQITVGFTLTGFGAGEILTGVTFDGIAVTPSP